MAAEGVPCNSGCSDQLARGQGSCTYPWWPPHHAPWAGWTQTTKIEWESPTVFERATAIAALEADEKGAQTLHTRAGPQRFWGTRAGNHNVVTISESGASVR